LGNLIIFYLSSSFGESIDFDTFVDIIMNKLGNNKTREGA